MTKKNQRDAQPAALHATTNYQAEYEEFCREKHRIGYEKFCRDNPAFRGGYADYLAVMQVVRDEIRCRAELAKIDQEQREIRDFFLNPPICLVPERERQELLRLFADEAGQPGPEFDHDDEYRYCRVPGLPPFVFTEQQGLAVKKIHAAMEKGKLGLTAEEVFNQIGSADTDYRLRRLFRGRAKAAIDTGFLKELRTGFWTLDILAGKRP